MGILPVLFALFHRTVIRLQNRASFPPFAICHPEVNDVILKWTCVDKVYSFAERPQSLAGTPSIPVFSDQELHFFQTWFEKGYDIDSDDRYNRWLRMYHPEGYELCFLEDSRVLQPTLRSGTPSDDQYLSDHSINTHQSPPHQFALLGLNCW